MVQKTRARRAHSSARYEHTSAGLFFDDAGSGGLEARPARRDRSSRAALYAAYDFLMGPLPSSEEERDAMDDALDAIAEDMRMRSKYVV